MNAAGGVNNVVSDYQRALSTARHWARIALQNKRDGLPWQQSATNAHCALRWALLIIH
jgi:hypothetical protein